MGVITTMKKNQVISSLMALALAVPFPAFGEEDNSADTGALSFRPVYTSDIAADYQSILRELQIENQDSPLRLVHSALEEEVAGLKAAVELAENNCAEYDAKVKETSGTQLSEDAAKSLKQLKGRCDFARENYILLSTELRDLIAQNLTESEAVKQGRIQTLIDESAESEGQKVVRIRSNALTLEPSLGFEYHGASSVVAQVLASYGASWRVGVQGGAFIGGESTYAGRAQRTALAPKPLGDGYEEEASLTTQDNHATAYHSFAGVRVESPELVRWAMRGRPFSFNTGVSANAYFGERVTATTKKREGQLRHNGTAVGQPHHIEDEQEARQNAYSLVPQIDATVRSNRYFATLAAGYDISRDDISGAAIKSVIGIHW